MSVIEELRQNDPDNTEINIDLHEEPSDADLAQALQQNPFVTEIDLSLEGEQHRADWNSFLHVIATRANLETVRLWDARIIAWPRNTPAVLLQLRSILRAIQQNRTVRRVEMCELPLPTDISTFVDNASSITSFRLSNCDGEQGARSLAVALQRNTNIETLELSSLNDIYAVPILEGLRSNVFLKTINFAPSSAAAEVSDATSHALQHLFESTTSIQKFELGHARFRERQFSLIAQAITSSECVSELELYECQFTGHESFAQLQSILQNKRNLTTLCLDCCSFVGGQVHHDIISLLSRPDSPLRCFEFQSHGNLEEFPGVHFRNLLQAIQMSKLERFEIGTIRTQQQLQTLTESIPSMHIRELEVDFWYDEGNDDEDDEVGELSREAIRQHLLRAVKNNFSLRTVKAEMFTETDDEIDGTNLFERAEDKQALAFYANRNATLDQWVDNPVTIEQQKVWPDALSLAERAGPNAFFRGLRSVLQSDCGSLPSGRKRKRPQLYTPS